MKILVLHSRLSGYWMACMRAFVETYGGSFTVIKKKASSNAPFNFADEKGINLHNFKSFTDDEMLRFCKRVEPDIVYVSGWSEEIYLEIARFFFKQDLTVITGLDNQWKNSLRQILGKFYFKYILPSYFTHIWIPGLYQFEFARKLGYSKENIMTGLYSADVNAFSNARKKNSDIRYPKSFLFVGRFIDKKGVLELAEAFREFKNATGSNWSLTLVGNGPHKEQLDSFDDIYIQDFIQPEKLPEMMSNHGVFVLPSLAEPWGVVVHEAAAAGLPIISTHSCGSATAFIRNGYNGYIIESGNVKSLKTSFSRISNCTDQELYRMGERSYELSLQITPHTWSSTLEELIAGIQ